LRSWRRGFDIYEGASEIQRLIFARSVFGYTSGDSTIRGIMPRNEWEFRPTIRSVSTQIAA